VKTQIPKEIILVNENDEEVGIAEKLEAHQKGLLHRAFSVFIFNDGNELLLQQRANNKYHSGGLWTNTCCSHPRPGEETKSGAKRRLREEMGFDTELTQIFHFTYRHVFENGLIEHEFDHVFTGFYNSEVCIDKNEANDYRYMSMENISYLLVSDPQKFTPWFHIAFPLIMEWLDNKSKK
jgi:isopentenyl-diphosphate delta-isomerase